MKLAFTVEFPRPDDVREATFRLIAARRLVCVDGVLIFDREAFASELARIERDRRMQERIKERGA